MNVYESIMQGLNEAIDYEKGEKTALSTYVTIVLPEVSADEMKSYPDNTTSALSRDMTQKRKLPNRYGIIKVEVLWSGAKRNGKGLQLSAFAKSFSRSN